MYELGCYLIIYDNSSFNSRQLSLFKKSQFVKGCLISFLEFDVGGLEAYHALVYAQFLIGAESINSVLDEFCEGGDVLLVLSQIQDVERKLVARFYHHLAALCTSCHHPYLDSLAQSQ